MLAGPLERSLTVHQSFFLGVFQSVVRESMLVLTDGPTDGPTDGRTKPLIEMRGRI